MPLESLKKKQKRFQQIITLLRRTYPSASCSLNFKNPLELLVATQLSAQCTDKRVNEVTKKLFQKYPNAKAYATAPIKSLEKDIQSTGFFRNKARNLKKSCQTLEKFYQGKVPKNFDQLTELAGVGRKTAHVVMGNGFQIPSGVVVDTHVKRLSNRMGLVQTDNVRTIEKQLEKLSHKKNWIMLSHLMIAHGRKICRARKALCSLCSLYKLCPRNTVQN